MYYLCYHNIRDKSVVIKELYLLNTVTLYPSLLWLTPKEKGSQRQALCIMVHLHVHLQCLTPRQTLRLTPSTAIHNNGAEIFNKMCSFEVSIGMLPLILIISSKESLL